jgi:hypothetical protein
MSRMYSVFVLRELPQSVVAAIRLIGQRDAARCRKDWEEADYCRDMALILLDDFGCEIDLKDSKDGTSLAVRISDWEIRFADTKVYDQASDFVGWLPHHGDRKCGAWRCSKCGRVTNVMPPVAVKCGWCAEVDTYERLID